MSDPWYDHGWEDAVDDGHLLEEVILNEAEGVGNYDDLGPYNHYDNGRDPRFFNDEKYGKGGG